MNKGRASGHHRRFDRTKRRPEYETKDGRAVEVEESRGGDNSQVRH
jgi:hypothetical protein